MIRTSHCLTQKPVANSLVSSSELSKVMRIHKHMKAFGVALLLLIVTPCYAHGEDAIVLPMLDMGVLVCFFVFALFGGRYFAARLGIVFIVAASAVLTWFLAGYLAGSPDKPGPLSNDDAMLVAVSIPCLIGVFGLWLIKRYR